MNDPNTPAATLPQPLLKLPRNPTALQLSSASLPALLSIHS
jgi:hypothetical protein